MRAIREAVAMEDPAEAVLATVAASAEHWERQGHILLTLKAVSELEPGAIALVDDQRRISARGWSAWPGAWNGTAAWAS